jgi:hypothetical protein
MKPRKPTPEQPDLLADIARLSQFPRRKRRQSGKFDGAHNPREFRFLQTVLHRHLTREEVDAVSGASNGPEIVNQLRSRGLEIPCYRLGTLDRDGFWTYRGLYALSHRDKGQVARALHSGKGGGQATQGTASDDEATTGGQPDES